MSERQPEHERAARQDEDEPDVEGHVLRQEPVEKLRARGDDAPEDGEDRLRH
jgi:hypothetical protein